MAEGAPLGIVDTLTEGFATLNKRLWLFLIPVVLDLFLAFGPGITAVSLVDASLNWAQENVPADAQGQQDLLADEGALETLRNSNVAAVLAWQFSSFVASSASDVVRNQDVGLDIAEPGQFIGILLGLGAGGLLLTSLYLGGIAGVLRQESVDGSFLQGVMRGWLRYLWLVALVIGLLIPVSIAAAVLLTLATLINEGVGTFLATMFITLLLAAFLYISMADDAIFAARVGPVRAIAYSVVVIRHYFWSALGLIIVIQIIQLGLRLALDFLSAQPVGLVGALVIYAYVATGLTVGSMLFFKQRLQQWQAQTQQGDVAPQ